MKKGLLCFALLWAWSMCISAWLKNVPLTLTQPDGTAIEALSTGDEYYHWLHDKADFTIVQNSLGWYVYAEQSSEDIVAGNLIVGRNSPEGLQPGLNKSRAWVAERKQRIKAIRQPGNILTPYNGTLNNIVICIKFAGETEMELPYSAINNMFNAQGVAASSLKQYYTDTSYNQLTINSSFYPRPLGEQIYAFTDINPRGYYQPYSPNNPIGYGTEEWAWLAREEEMLVRAINSASQMIPPTLNVDSDYDGFVDNLCFIIKGATGAWADLLWPHMGTLWDVPASINGASPANYNLQLESFLSADYGGASVLAHEMFHSIGAPDLYRYENTSITPVGYWDLMSNNSVPPQQTGAWMKHKYGHWVSAPTPILTSGTYTLAPLGAAPANISYRINSWRANEYYILEYRKPCGFIDAMIPLTGLLVYRLLLNEQGNDDGPPDELYIYRPNSNSNAAQGSLYSAALSQQTGWTAITETTIPSGFTSINTPGGLNLYEVGEAGETITFKVKISEVQLTSPVGEETWVSGSQRTIRWRAKSSQGNVKLEFSANLGQNWLTVVESTPNNGSFVWQPPNLDSDQCVIKVSLLNSYHDDSCTYPFSVVSSLAAPNLAYPITGATNIPTNPLLAWQKVPGATSYNIQIATDPDFISCVLNVAAHPDSSYQVSGLLPQTMFYWRVASRADEVVSGYSAVQYFTTGEISEVPGVPVLVSPLNFAINQSLTPILAWNNEALASEYHLQMAFDAYFSNLAMDTNTGGQSFWLASPLSPNTIYFWRVASVNVAGSSVYSNCWRFTTGDGSTLDDIASVPITDCLLPNYPNPFNPNTTISLSVADLESPLQISIYNLRGQLVKQLYCGLPTGNEMHLIWDARDETGTPTGSGIYIYRMTTGKFTQQRKMLLVK